MADPMLKKGMAWLAGKMKAVGGIAAVYSRGNLTANLTVIPGKTLLALMGQYGSRVEWTDADVSIEVADLVLDGNKTEPRRDDQLRIVFGGETVVFAVRAPGEEPVWRWSDEYRTAYRVHLKEIDRE